MNRLVPLLAVLTVVCAGCIPLRMTDAPELRGEVLDSETKTPIGGAVVEIKTQSESPPSSQARTDASGKFFAPEILHTVWVFPSPYDTAIFQFPVTVSAPGYDTLQEDYGSLTRTRGHAALVTIYLTRHRNS